MRHGRTHNHLGRTNTHRSAMLSNMACSLIEHKRIETTLPKARELRKYVEPLLTKAKTDSTHSRRIAFSYLQDKEAMKELFGTVAEKIANRPGGYTRIIKLGTRLGDNADLALIELVDFNELLLTEAKPAKARTRRSRRGTGTGTAAGGAEMAYATAASTTDTTALLSELAPAGDVATLTETTAQDEMTTAPEAAVAETPTADIAQAETPSAEANDTPEAPASEESREEEQA